MRDEDFTAILAYLKSMPAVKHLVVNQAPPTWCEVCEQSHGGGAANKISAPDSFDPNYTSPWDLAGTYGNESGKPSRTVVKQAEHWLIARADAEPTPLIAVAENKYQAVGFTNFISFEIDETGEVTSLREFGWNERRFARRR